MKTIYQDEYRRLIEVLITARKQQNLTQADVAKQLHKPVGWVERMRNPTFIIQPIDFVKFPQKTTKQPKPFGGFYHHDKSD